MSSKRRHKSGGSSRTEAEERERLTLFVKERLRKSGWRQQLKDHAKKVVEEKGVENLALEDLVKVITPKARSLVPDDVKVDLLSNIREFLVAKD